MKTNRYPAFCGERLLYLGSLLPQPLVGLVEQDAAPQISALRFQRSLIKALTTDVAVRVEAICVPPVSAFPANSAVVTPTFPRAPWSERVHLCVPRTMNWGWSRLASRFLAILYAAVKAQRAGPFNWVIVYALHSPLVLAAAVTKFLFRTRVAIFIPDLPENMVPGSSGAGLRRILKRIDRLLLKRVVATFDVAFPITPQIARDFLPPSMPWLPIEGISEGRKVRDVAEQVEPTINRRVLLYAGNLALIETYLEAISSLPSELSAEFHFAGKGPLQSRIEELALEDSRVRYLGFLRDEQLAMAIHAADVLVNPRSTAWEGGRYSFPSKLIDYMQRGRAVATTMTDGIPAEYAKVVYVLNDDSLLTMVESITTILREPPGVLAQRAELSRRFIDELKSPEAVGARILGFLKDVQSRV